MNHPSDKTRWRSNLFFLWLRRVHPILSSLSGFFTKHLPPLLVGMGPSKKGALARSFFSLLFREHLTRPELLVSPLSQLTYAQEDYLLDENMERYYERRNRGTNNNGDSEESIV